MKSYFPTIKKYLFDIVIVFLGVFMAFQLNRYQSDKASKKIELGYYKIILIEFQNNLQEVKMAKTSLQNYLDNFTKTQEEGNTPELISMNKFMLDNNLFVIMSAFESGHLENLNPLFVTNISNGSNFITRVTRLIDQYNNKLNLALQNAEWDHKKFFDEKGQLKSTYSWYINDLEFIANYLDQLELAFEKGAIPEITKIIEDKE